MLELFVLKKQYENFQKKKKEGFSETGSLTGLMSGFLVHIVIVIIAVYLSFKCNDGISIELLFAICCPACYLIYRLFAGCNTNE
jgi:hypothetical protein